MVQVLQIIMFNQSQAPCICQSYFSLRALVFHAGRKISYWCFHRPTEGQRLRSVTVLLNLSWLGHF